jgi:hypothetical protein
MLLIPKGSKYALAEEYTYKDVTIPIGYLTDGVSYKFRLVGVFINRFDPLYIEAAVVHDYLTDQGDWDKANKYFEELLPKTKTTWCMVAAVNSYRKVIGE